MAQSPFMDNNCGQLPFQHNESVAVKRKKGQPGTPTKKSVVVLKRSDVTIRNDLVFMPNTIEMAQLKKPDKGQFKTNVQISSKMTEVDIKRILVENFPFLEHQRFWCAAAVDNRTRLDFHGERRIWDGRFLNRTLKGNSALYIFTDEDPTVSEQSTPKRSHDQITSVESGKLEPSSKRIATTENVPKTTSHTAYSPSLPMGEPIFNVQQIERDASKGTSNTDLSLELKKIASDKGFIISDNQGGGNCMFHVLSEQLYHVKGIKISHQELRHKVVNYLKNNPKLRNGTELFNFVDRYPSWNSYLTNMAEDGTWGDHVILHGAANYFKTYIHVISSLSHHNDVIIEPECVVASSNQLVLGHVYELHYVSLIPSTPGDVVGQPGMAQKIVSTASDQQSLGEPVLPLVTHTVPHEMMSSTLTSQINNLTSQLGNLNIPKAASMQIQEPVDVKKCTGFTQHVLPVTTSAQSTGNRSFANELCREASAGQHHNAFRSLDHSKQSTAVNTQVLQPTCTVTRNSNQDLDPFSSTQILPQISGQQDIQFDPFFFNEGLLVRPPQFSTVIDNSNQTDHLGWYPSSSHQTEEESDIINALMTSEPTSDFPFFFDDILEEQGHPSGDLFYQNQGLNRIMPGSVTDNTDDNTVTAASGVQVEEQGHPSGDLFYQNQGLYRIMPGSVTDNTDDNTVKAASGVQVEVSGQGSSSSDRELPFTTSGFEDDDSMDLSEQNQNLPALEEEQQYELKICPVKVTKEGGTLCVLTVTPMFPVIPVLPAEVSSVEFVNLQTVQADRCGDFTMTVTTPPAQKPGKYTVILRDTNEEKLAETTIEYVDEDEEYFKKLVNDKERQQRLIIQLLKQLGGKSETSLSGEKQNSGNLGSTQVVESTHGLPVEELPLLAYVVVKVLFNSSGGKAIVDSCEESAALPEFTSHYLEDIITRISKQMTSEGSQKIDWSEIMAAAKAVQEQHGLSVGEESDQPESDENSGYYGDVESLSSGSSEAASDSEDDLSEMFSKVSVKENESQLEEDALKNNKDENYYPGIQSSFNSLKPQGSEKEIKATNSCLNESFHALKESVPKDQTLQLRPVTALRHLMSFVSEGAFASKQVDIKVKHQANKHGVNQNHAFQAAFCDHCIALKSVGHLGISFFLSMAAESIPCHLSPVCERWGIHLQSIRDSGEMTTHWLSIFFHKMHLNLAEGRLLVSLSKPAVAVEGDGKFGIMKPLQQFHYSPVKGASDLQSSYVDDAFPSPNNGETFDHPAEHCHSTASDIWVLTSVYRPTRKSLFVYVADSKDVLPPESCLEDEDCELLMQCWKWQFSKRLKDMQEQSGVFGCTDGLIGNHDVFHANRAPDLHSPMSLIALASEHCHPFTVAINEGNEVMTSHQGFNNIMSASSTDSAALPVVTGMTTPRAQVEVSGDCSNSSVEELIKNGISEVDLHPLADDDDDDVDCNDDDDNDCDDDDDDQVSQLLRVLQEQLIQIFSARKNKVDIVPWGQTIFESREAVKIDEDDDDDVDCDDDDDDDDDDQGSVWPGKCKSIDEICAELSWPWDNMKDKQDKQMTTEGSQTIDCSELMEAPKAAQEQHGLSDSVREKWRCDVIEFCPLFIIRCSPIEPFILSTSHVTASHVRIKPSADNRWLTPWKKCKKQHFSRKKLIAVNEEIRLYWWIAEAQKKHDTCLRIMRLRFQYDQGQNELLHVADTVGYEQHLRLLAKLAEAYKLTLSCSGQHRGVFELTPGVIKNLCHVRRMYEDDNAGKSILLFGGSSKYFKLKECNIAAQSTKILKKPSYNLTALLRSHESENVATIEQALLNEDAGEEAGKQAFN